MAHEVEAAAHRAALGSHGAACSQAGGRHRRDRAAEAASPVASARPSTAFGAFLHGTASVPAAFELGGSVRGRLELHFLLERDSAIRAPAAPRPPFASAHDVVREARLQLALREAGFPRLPTIAAVCEDEEPTRRAVLRHGGLDGLVPTDELPAGLERSLARALGERSRRSLGETDVVMSDARSVALATPGSYNERQVCRFSQLWEMNKTREIPGRGGRRAARRADPDPLESTVVHGDFRLGNTMVAGDDLMCVLPSRLGDGRDRRSACRRRLPPRDEQRAGRPAESAWARRR